MNGASRLKVLTKIILPLLGPAIAAVGIYSFITGRYYYHRPSHIYHYAGGDR